MTAPSLVHAWAAVVASPLFGLVLTLGVYLASERVYRATRAFPLANPVLVSVIAIVTLLHATGTSYEAYMHGAR